MKTVQLNEAGYTADGKWRLVLVEPTDSMKDSAQTDHAVWCELSKNGLADLLKQKDARIAELTEQLTDAQDKLEKMFASASNISESAVTLLMQRDELRNRVAELEKVLAAIVDNPDDNTYWIKQAKAAIDAARVEYDIGRHPEKGTQ